MKCLEGLFLDISRNILYFNSTVGNRVGIDAILIYTPNWVLILTGVKKVPFHCPKCSWPRSLRIISSLELPPDARSDEINIQIIQCRNCGFNGLAVYEETRRGSLETEHIHHTGYHVEEENLNELMKMIKGCPQPMNHDCGCIAHQELGRKNTYGYWDGLRDKQLGLSFEMRIG